MKDMSDFTIGDIKMALAANPASVPETPQPPDPFFSEPNLAHVKKSVQELQAGKGTAHERIEVALAVYLITKNKQENISPRKEEKKYKLPLLYCFSQ